MAVKTISNKKKQIHAGELITIKDPQNDLKIVGLDTPYTEEYHFVWCPRAKEIPTTSFIKSIEDPNMVIEPIHVCKNGNSLLVIAGRFRVKAARIIIAKQIAAGVPQEERLVLQALVHTGDPEHLQKINIIENSKNQYTLQQQAQMCEFHLRRNGYNYGALSKTLNIPEYKARRLVKLLQCTPEVIEAFSEETLAIDLIDDFEKLERHQQNIALEKIRQKNMSAHTARKIIEKVLNGENEPDLLPTDSKIGKKALNRILFFANKEKITNDPYIQGAIFMIEWQMGFKTTEDSRDKTFQTILERALSYNLENELLKQLNETPEQSYGFKELLKSIYEKYEGLQISTGQLHYTLQQLLKNNKISKNGEKYILKK